ncbi:hypothetical protein HU200_002701 [Digitaria exilis]|uniref:beta-galactosidase n=1 Tax=Digitaria exilis TaxID=1010633 RepID=A0A835FY90_9POAL|nr:hypothetical protein HU200_002701 [Digitaria exilis]
MPRSMAVAAAALVVLAALHTSAAAEIQRREVSYDGRALIVDGTRRMLFSGEMHYTRSTPEMWPTLIAKAKEGGLDVIQTYVFWNVHEPVKGQIENEYQMVERAFGSSGSSYVPWAAAMAVSLQTGVPWMMCKQDDAPDPVINAQHGSRTALVVQSLSDIDTWKAFKEPIPLYVKKAMYTTSQLLEQLSATKDETDYLWYTVSHEYRSSGDGQLVLLNATFATPAGNDPVALNLVGMGKGEVWINGESIGRYWVSLEAPSSNPSQSLLVWIRLGDQGVLSSEYL